MRAENIPKPVVLDLNGLAQSPQNDPKLGQRKRDHSPRNCKHPVHFVTEFDERSITWAKQYQHYQTASTTGSSRSSFISPLFLIGVMRKNHPKVSKYLSFCQMASWFSAPHVVVCWCLRSYVHSSALPKTKSPKTPLSRGNLGLPSLSRVRYRVSFAFGLAIP